MLCHLPVLSIECQAEDRLMQRIPKGVLKPVRAAVTFLNSLCLRLAASVLEPFPGKICLTLSPILLMGCGTLNNTIVGTPPAPPHEYTPPMEVYGGVRSDLQDAVRAVTPPYATTVGENLTRVAGAAIVLADVPLSAVGDTLTLGKTIPASLTQND